jgi:anti-sigma factor ChrR (cupin superfamily)
VERVGIAEGRVQWADAGTRPAAALEVQQLKLEASTISWPLRHTIPFEVQAQVMAGERAVGELLARGEASEQRVRVQAEAKQIDLAAGEPYLAPLLRRRLEGRLDLNAEWELTEPFGSARQALKLASVVVNDLRLVPKGVTSRKALAAQDVAALKRLEIADAQVSPERRHVSLARVSVLQPTLELARDATGRFNAMDWIAQNNEPAGSAPVAASTAASAPANGSDEPPAWAVSLDRLQIDGGRLRWRDAAAPATEAEPVHLALDTLKLDARRIAWPLATEASKVVFSTRLRPIGDTDRPTAASEDARDRQQPARIEWAGDVATQPIAARGRLTVERLPVHALTAYGGRNIPVDLRRADAGFKGGVDMKMLPAGLQMRVDGDARLTDVRVFARAANAAGSGDELMNWQSFDIPALKLQLAPGAKPSVEVGEATLTDFYAKLLITEQGRLNLNDVGATAAQDAAIADSPAASASAASPSAAPAPAAAEPAPPASAAVAAAVPSTAASTAASGAAPARRGLPLNLVLGGVKLVNGNVDFTDRFIRPNYSALLSELNGRIGSFRSGATEMAPLELTGRAAGTALLDIRGSVNPTADPLALDIRAKATDLELAPLSPYAGKYAGYKIERGKLSMDVQYSIKPDGTLQANNQVILNQLTFGEKVDSPSATSLPVRLAVALLKDSDGVIDINLPISGSLNDPEFSFGRLILRVIVNLLVKVATSPFSLLAGGGGEQSNTVEFVPGTATLTAPSGDVVTRVGQALTKRPNLILTVAGAADSDAERDAIAKANFDAMLRSEWRKQQLRAGKAADQAASSPENAAAGAAPEVMPKAERDRIIKAIYQDTKLPTKPRNLVGWPKDIPVPEMEALLMAAQPAVSADAARELALRRGIAVRDALIAQGLPSERLFLAAPKVGDGNAGSGDAQGFKPKVELSLAPR